MTCNCGHRMTVFSTRVDDGGVSVTRRRKCHKCGNLLTTVEVHAHHYHYLKMKAAKR